MNFLNLFIYILMLKITLAKKYEYEGDDENYIKKRSKRIAPFLSLTVMTA